MSRLEKTEEKIVPLSFLFISIGWGSTPSDIRPRAFPLWLLAPRFLGAVLFLATRPCWGVLGHRLLLGRGRNPLPSFGLLLAVSYYFFSSFLSIVLVCISSLRLECLRSPPSHNPHPHFHLRVYFKILYFCDFVRDGAHIQPRHSGNVRGSNSCVLASPTRARTLSALGAKKERAENSQKPKSYFFVHYSFSSFTNLLNFSFFFQSFEISCSGCIRDMQKFFHFVVCEICLLRKQI